MRALYLAILLLASVCSFAHAESFSATPVRLPFRIQQGLILVPGRVDSTSGVFMLDTGETYFRFLLNRNYVPLGPGSDLYKMHAASGQVSRVQTHAGRHRIVLAGVFSTGAESGAENRSEDVVSEDAARMQRNIAPDLLGVIGYGFLKHYDFSIDYRKRTVSLYPLGAVPAHAGGIAITFAPASPVVPFMLTVGGAPIPTLLDTGGWERLEAPAQLWQRLASGGHIAPGRTGDTGCVRILRAGYGAHEFDIPHAEKVTASKPMLTLGYPFLRHYLSVWNPAKGTVTLIRKGRVRRLPPSSCN